MAKSPKPATSPKRAAKSDVPDTAYATLAASQGVDAKIARAKLRRKAASDPAFVTAHFLDDDKRWIVKGASVDTIAAFIKG